MLTPCLFREKTSAAWGIIVGLRRGLKMENESLLVRLDQDEIEGILSALNHIRETTNSIPIQLVDVEQKLKSALNQKGQ